MGIFRLVGVFVCGLFVMDLINSVRTNMTDKTCTERYTYTRVEIYEGYTSCPHYEQVCNGWFLSRRCRTYTRYYLCPRQMSRIVYKSQNLPVCCPGYQELANGTCLRACTENMYGEQCQYKCNCSNHAYQDCDIDTGNCTCLPGWTGSNCDQVCPDGWFGSYCDRECLCQNNATCSPLDGACNCTSPGWTGEFCDKECNSTKYGQNCQGNCTCSINQTCDRMNGLCRCMAGRTGRNCTEECPLFKFGPDCSKNCSCKHSTGCDAVNGECICEAGFTGKKCHRVCATGTFGKGCNQTCNCTDAEICNPVTGECVSRCVCHERGTANCHTLYDSCKCLPNHNHTCHSESWFAKEKCRDVCECISPDSTCCVANTSRCQCKDGWTGPKCSKECPRGTFGRHCANFCNCSADDQCHHETGACISKRKPVAEKSVSTKSRQTFWIISGGFLLLLVVMTISLIIFLRSKHAVSRTPRKHFCQNSDCFNCCRPNKKESLATQRYTELQEDLDWVVHDEEYDHLNRSGQAKFQLQLEYDPTYSHVSDNSTAYSAITSSSNTVTSEGDYSHISLGNATYDTLENKKVKFSDNANTS
ncbi:multiple epidermal growth factor-like domains protein 10 [Saccostrea echinata]|uniref:multiple epidermal growth factor-like domains protein 10 n=1 Tax=Saccostrea echinata TaxID=191078 RepID=UPI002A80492B|nr:multiple epidermal growth factor-like domains protein 10 [Saccostrea echinata]